MYSEVEMFGSQLLWKSIIMFKTKWRYSRVGVFEIQYPRIWKCLTYVLKSKW
jgi:hypothetical protein